MTCHSQTNKKDVIIDRKVVTEKSIHFRLHHCFIPYEQRCVFTVLYFYFTLYLQVHSRNLLLYFILISHDIYFNIV